MNTQEVETVAQLAGAVDVLSAKDQVFARSLLKQHARTHGLSVKQMYWVGKLAARALGTEPERPASTVGDFSGVYALMYRARAHLKYPKIRLALDDGMPVVLSMAGNRSRHPGTINVTDGGPYGMNRWFGRIEQDGTWTQGRNYGRDDLNDVGVLLTKLGQDPEGVASAHGRLTGSCCFCHHRLDDEKSTSVGYGPVCAKNYGLAWGGKTSH